MNAWLATLVSWVANWQVAAWGVVAAVTFVATAAAAGMEIGLFSLSRIRLRLRTAHQDPAALQLQEWLRHPTYALEGLLILQNIFGFLFSASVTRIVALTWHLNAAGQVIVSTALLTPVVLVFSDIMPKDLFHRHADRWVYRLVPALRWALRAITVMPLLPVVRAVSGASVWIVNGGRTVSTPMVGPRTEILNLFQESAATGVVSGTQQDLVQRALRMARITIREVMIPWNRVVGVPATISRDGFRALVRHYNVSRMPVLGKNTTEVLGLVEVLDVLGDPTGYHLLQHVRPTMTLIAEQSVRSAITLMQKARQTIAVVVDRQGRAIGLVTMKDLIEELIGDLENW